MKTKLTLFVAVIAVALFGMGCVSPPTPHPNALADINGTGFLLKDFGLWRTNDVTTRLTRIFTADKSVKGNVSIPRQSNRSGEGNDSARATTDAKFSILNGNNGLTTQVKVSDVKDEKSFQWSMKGNMFAPAAAAPKGISPGQHNGRSYVIKKDKNEKWSYPYHHFEGFFGDGNIFPSGRVKIGHEWSNNDWVSKIIRAAPSARSGGASIPTTSIPVKFKFERIEQFGGERCAVISITLTSTQKSISGRGGPAKITASSSGEIYRSLDSGRTLKGEVQLSVSMSQTQSQNTPSGRASMSLGITGKYKISESEKLMVAE
jgi:hypothetical protein